ncbi:hypothetical protein DERP_004521 [Dermatophagoides pteronyssinus]|uniref:Uncharacterized protein n=1 Tax=Dermatophagoides pteronyssinus TaxID=6956 RepID=A0ABQ8JP10_DERPT|nr:hypothetical protein DERP_004521 [Dermatophagoides pteronyssinus]
MYSIHSDSLDRIWKELLQDGIEHHKVSSYLKSKKQYLNNGLVLSTEMVNCPSSRASLRKTEPPNSLFSICIP